jgi:hypothetical protein
LVAAAALLLGAVAAPAAVIFPRPGVLAITDLPASLQPGETLTLREELPVAVQPGEVALELRSAEGWRTVALAAVRPRTFWLRWTVPARPAGTQLTVRLVLTSGAQTLAASPSYTIAIESPGGGSPSQ